MYVEKAYNTVDSDSSVGWGRYAWRPPWCFSKRAGYETAPGFIFSLLSSSASSHTALLHYTNSYTYSHPNLNFLQYTIQILIPHVMWSAKAVRDSKIDHTQRPYPPCMEPEPLNSSVANGAVDAGANLRPPVNRTSDLYMHCGCAELISECQLHNDMDIFCLFRERI